MRVVDEEKLQENARVVGNYLLEKGNELMKTFTTIGDVRGVGLFVGFELVDNRSKRNPATAQAKWTVNRMKNNHQILVSSDGPDTNVIKLKPPMVFSIENADQFLAAFRECLAAYENEHSQQNEIITELNKTVSKNGNTESCHNAINSNHIIPDKRDQIIKSV